VNALLSARKAEKLGYKNVKVFEAGWPAWKKAGHMVVSDIADIKDLNKLEASYVLIDLRSEAQMAEGHIARAVRGSNGKVDHLKSQLPLFKGATIILYNDDGNPRRPVNHSRQCLNGATLRSACLTAAS
jgi:rhodanese-related sulfurtransferase